MKRLCCIIAIMILLCGCDTKKAITLNKHTYHAEIDVKFCNKTYQYILTKNENHITYEACGNTLPIDFNTSKNNIITIYNKQKAEYKTQLDNSFVNIISQVLWDCENQEVYPDYNGNYILYEPSQFGEYSFKINEKGLPVQVSVNSKDLFVKFANVKEVYNGS